MSVGVGFELESQGFEAGSWIRQASGGLALDSPPHPEPAPGSSFSFLLPLLPTKAQLDPSWAIRGLRIPRSWTGRPRPLGQEVSQAHLCSGMLAWNHTGTLGFACLLGTKLP